VGAAHKYGDTATVIATHVKLARALWIVPLCIVTAAVNAARQGAMAVVHHLLCVGGGGEHLRARVRRCIPGLCIA